MTAEAQIITNSRNAQKSTGPRTLSMSFGAPADCFMQNKPNFRKDKMNVRYVLTNHYENKRLVRRSENKPNSNPIKPNSNPKTNIHPKNKPNQTQLQRQKNATTTVRLELLIAPAGSITERYGFLTSLKLYINGLLEPFLSTIIVQCKISSIDSRSL